MAEAYRLLQSTVKQYMTLQNQNLLKHDEIWPYTINPLSERPWPPQYRSKADIYNSGLEVLPV